MFSGKESAELRNKAIGWKKVIVCHPVEFLDTGIDRIKEKCNSNAKNKRLY